MLIADDDHTSCILFFLHLNMIIFIMSLNFLFRKNLKLQKSQDLKFFWSFKDADDDHISCILFFWHLNIIIFIMSLNILYCVNAWNNKNLRIKIFFWFFKESDLIWMMAKLVIASL